MIPILIYSEGLDWWTRWPQALLVAIATAFFLSPRDAVKKKEWEFFPNQMSRSSGVAKGQKLVCPMSSSTFSYIVTPKRLTNTGVHHFPLIHMYTSSALVGASFSSFGTYGFHFFCWCTADAAAQGDPSTADGALASYKALPFPIKNQCSSTLAPLAGKGQIYHYWWF